MNKVMMAIGVILFLVGGYNIINSNKSDAQIAYEAGRYQMQELIDDMDNSVRGNPGYRTSDYEANSLIRAGMFQSRLFGFISLLAGIFLFFMGYQNQKKE